MRYAANREGQGGNAGGKGPGAGRGTVQPDVRGAHGPAAREVTGLSPGRAAGLGVRGAA